MLKPRLCQEVLNAGHDAANDMQGSPLEPSERTNMLTRLFAASGFDLDQRPL